MYPIRFEPIYQDYVWGGGKISAKYQRSASLKKIAESWEISDRSDAMSIVANGAFRGRTLHDLILEFGEKILGEGQKFDRFPLLLKIIDAEENLSIQVHPDEESAQLLKGEPKTEAWFAIEPGSVYAGLTKGTDKETFLKSIDSGKVLEHLNKIDLSKGDIVYIPGGTVHAICAKSLLFEVQQNSNTTYRIYDWGRKGRPLHLKEAEQAIRWFDHPHLKIDPKPLESDLRHQLLILLASPYFVIDKINVFNHWHAARIPKTFQIYFFLHGEGTLSADGYKETFKPGMTYLIPASSAAIEIEGRCEALRVRLP